MPELKVKAFENVIVSPFPELPELPPDEPEVPKTSKVIFSSKSKDPVTP
jgi:hypothetical protein